MDRLYESDSTDDDLESFRGVRSLIARVRDEAPSLEPPQAISARLLLAADEHAPRRAVAPVQMGFFARIFSWLSPVTAHPGVLAAATLVVVAGAVVVWKQRGGKVEEPSYQAERSADEKGEAPLEEKKEATKEEAPVVAQEKGDAPAATGEGTVATAPGPDKVALAKPERRSEKKGVKPPAPPKEPGAHAEAKPEEDAETPMELAESQQPPPPPADTTAKGNGKDVAPEPTADKKPESKPQAETDAQRLTRDARTAARKGKCGEVEDLAGRVNELDPGYYRDVFVKDPDIKACRTAR